MTVLIIAAAIIGFGLFGADFRYGGSVWSPAMLMRLLYGFMALIHYGVVIESVRRLIKQSSSVTGAQVANGPLFFTALLAAYVAMIFIVGVFETPTSQD